jgi:hypothetical protein
MQTDLNQRMGELVEQLPWISDVDSAKVANRGPGGALVGLASGPKASYHIHLSPCVHICHLFLIFAQISYKQINLHVQVELGEV